jgi:hypothetical protein
MNNITEQMVLTLGRIVSELDRAFKPLHPSGTYAAECSPALRQTQCGASVARRVVMRPDRFPRYLFRLAPLSAQKPTHPLTLPISPKNLCLRFVTITGDHYQAVFLIAKHPPRYMRSL